MAVGTRGYGIGHEYVGPMRVLEVHWCDCWSEFNYACILVFGELEQWHLGIKKKI